MALAPDVSSGTNGEPADTGGRHVDEPSLRYFVFALFFIFGGITSLNDVIIPKLKELFTLNYTQAMLVQFCFFTAYLVIGIPGAQLVKKIGYMRGAVAGLLTMMVGCLLFIPASQNATYALFLMALFVLASGVVVVQVVANPLISLLGPPRTVHSRLTFAQAFNSLGTVIFPFVGSLLILAPLASKAGEKLQPYWDVSWVVDPLCSGASHVAEPALTGAALSAYRTAETQVVAHTYLGLAIALSVVAAAVWLYRNKLQHDASRITGSALTTPMRYAIGVALVILGGVAAVNGHAAIGIILMLMAPTTWLYGNDLLRRRRFSFGALCIFLYVGAEVSIGSMMVNYLKSDHTVCLTEQSAGKQLLFYWGGAMVGRFVGSYILARVSPGKLLAGNAVGAIALIVISMMTNGATAAWSLLAVGLMNSIMFPTIFSLACEKLGARAADGSGIINIAIFGGAVMPLLTGMLADKSGSIAFSMVIPVLCYAIIAAFGIYARRPA